MGTRTLVARCALNASHLLIAASVASTASAQWLEFRGAGWDARVDNLWQDYACRLGDRNGNGFVDQDEFVGPLIAVDRIADRDSRTLTDFRSPPEPASQFNSPIYYPDFATFRVVDAVASRSYLRSSSVQVTQVLTFDDVDEPQRNGTEIPTRINRLDVAYGMRFVAMPEQYSWIAYGGVLDFVRLDAAVANQTAGPLLSMRTTNRRGRWEATAGTSMTLGYNAVEANQSMQVGRGPVLGGLYSLINAQSTKADYQSDRSEFSPVAELNLRVSYDLTYAMQIFVGFDLLHLNAMHLAEESIIWRLPDAGIADQAGTNVWQSTAGVGIQWVR